MGISQIFSQFLHRNSQIIQNGTERLALEDRFGMNGNDGPAAIGWPVIDGMTASGLARKNKPSLRTTGNKSLAVIAGKRSPTSSGDRNGSASHFLRFRDRFSTGFKISEVSVNGASDF